MYKRLQEHIKKRLIPYVWLLILACTGSFVLFFEIISGEKSGNVYAHFFDVGQGDSEFFVFPGGSSLLIDGGPWNGMLRKNIEKAQGGISKRYIDMLAITHPEEDHFGGILDIIDIYDFGVFVWNGKEVEASESFQELLKKIKGKGIPMVTLNEESIMHGEEWWVSILNPDAESLQKKTNETSLVFLIRSKGLDVLITGDIGKEIEEKIIGNIDKKIDVLKVSHHGSKFSSSQIFLESILPKFSVIEVGKNSYGHPSQEALRALEKVKSKIFRTDRDGMIVFMSDGEKIKVSK